VVSGVDGQRYVPSLGLEIIGVVGDRVSTYTVLIVPVETQDQVVYICEK
jgi:hypothetical protein